jgi:hypothetical protein
MAPTRSRKSARREARPGDVYAVKLPDGRFGAVRVLRVIALGTALVATTTYIDHDPPRIDDERLREILKETWGKPGHRNYGKPCMLWYGGGPPDGIELIGSIPPNQSEQKMGGKDAGWGFAGKWQPGVGTHALVAWRFEHDRAAWDAERTAGDAHMAAHRANADKVAAGDARPSPRKGTHVITDDSFWDLVALIGSDGGAADEAALKPLVSRLARSKRDAIKAFDDCLARKLHELDGLRFAKEIGRYAYGGEASHFSVDTFLYARCAAVAKGRAFFEKVLADPRHMPKDEEFEALLSVASCAYEKKTGEEYDHSPETDYETFSNEAGWA